ncbi:glycosyltransferase [Pseudogulbenkiania subflava]|uniref:Glycosyltransferase Family 4 n=1 Tax=Pseudogulbenkiania subflava DSM 22618 TaxID=1123014 RepID=A0A1Y6BDM0_9NEIS|nr:glycosyltransferase [Pseudogulbenkiania subflava]SMF02281.1 Glycosyltransferase Family 4 [Pseudogulbenkiania subflava DSM 22618]
MKAQTILFIIDGLAGGGAEKVVLSLAGAMAVRGHDVTIASLRKECAYPIPEGVTLLQVEDHYRGPFRRQTEIGRRARQLDQALAGYFAERPIDLAISSLPKTDRIVAASKRLRNAWMCLHGAVVQSQLGRRHGISRWFKRRQLTATYHQRKLLLVSPGLQQDLALLPAITAQSLVTIPNPFDFGEIARLAAAPCPLDNQPFLLHVGRFHPVKRHDRLLQAFARSHYSGQLVLLGKGTKQETSTIRHEIARLGLTQRVLLAGFQENPYPYLRAAEALVLSSDTEGFGNVLIEALACGTPVVSTDCPFGPRSILSGPLATGLAACDPDSLAAAIDRVVATPPQLPPGALDRFAIDHVVDQYLALATLNTATDAKP